MHKPSMARGNCSVGGIRQRGAALFLSLVILMALSVVGIYAMRGGYLQLLMASNTQQSEVALNAADSGIRAMSNWANLLGQTPSTPGDPLALTHGRTSAGMPNLMTLNLAASSLTWCLNSSAVLVSCPSGTTPVYLDQGNGNRIQVRVTMTNIADVTGTTHCVDFDSGFGCAVGRIDGVATVGEGTSNSGVVSTISAIVDYQTSAKVGP